MQAHTKAIALLKQAGHDAYLVGGCVRDKIMGREVHDWDVVTSAEPFEIKEAIKDHKILEIGVAFGIVIAMIDDERIEIASYRDEGEYKDGRRPNWVKTGVSLLTDARRRDFRINSMYLDPITGKIIDHYDGQQDIEKKIIRTIGNPYTILKDDKLRALRAIRFACVLGFQIQEDLYLAISQINLGGLSAERIQIELLKIMGSPNPVLGIEYLRELNLLDQVLPSVYKTYGEKHDPIYHPEGCVYTHSLGVLKTISELTTDPVLRLTAIMHDVGKCDCKQYRKEGKITRISNSGHAEWGAEVALKDLEDLRFDNKTKDRIYRLIQNHMIAHELNKMRRGKLMGFIRNNKDIMDDLILLQHSDSINSLRGIEKSNREFLLKKLEELQYEIDNPRWFSGRDLIDLGLAPGPRFKLILEKLSEIQDGGRFASKDDMFESLKNIFKNKTGDTDLVEKLDYGDEK